MKILINGYGVDFMVEHEKSAKEIADSIMKWANDRNMIFTDLYIDGEPFSVNNLPDKNIESIDEINCLVQSKSDLIISTINEAASYSERIIQFIKKTEETGKADFTQKDLLVKGIDWLKCAATSIFSLLSLNPDEIKYLDRPVSFYLQALNDVVSEITSSTDEISFKSGITGKKDLFETIKSVFKMLYMSGNLKEIIIKSLDSPEQLIEGLKNSKAEMSAQAELIEKAAAAFQSGKDSEGADMLQSFIDFIYKYIRLCHQVSPVFGIDPSSIVHENRSLEEVNGEIYSYLEEIVSVMENNDIISLSDILEYQMKGQLEICGVYIDLMLEKIR